jgi:hypothetical protein
MNKEIGRLGKTKAKKITPFQDLIFISESRLGKMDFDGGNLSGFSNLSFMFNGFCDRENGID